MRIRHIPALVALLFAGFVWADGPMPNGDCYRYQSSYFCSNGGFCEWFTEPVAACALIESLLESNNPGRDYTLSSIPAGPNGNALRCQMTWESSTGSGSVTAGNTIQLTGVVDAERCSVPAQCDGSITGRHFTKVFARGGAEPPGSYCDDDSGCRVKRGSLTVCLGGSCAAGYDGTDEPCESGMSSNDAQGEGEACAGDFCKAADQPSNCGFLNDQFVCLGKVKEDSCQVMGDGSRVCGQSAPTPPVPDNGTPGQPATPDATVDVTDSQGNTTINNYYSNTTVGGSSRDPGSSGENPYKEGDADGSGEGSGSGEGFMCDPSTDEGCGPDGDGGEGDDPRSGWQCWADGAGFTGAVASCFQQGTQAVWNGLVNDSSLLNVARSIGENWPSGGGQCPSATVELLEQNFDFWEVPCTFLDDIEGVLGPLFLLMWSIMGVRILLTIPGGVE